MGQGPSVDTRAQAEAADRSRAELSKMWGEQKDMAQPWLETGKTALSSLANNDFMKNWQADPGYQFRMDQGLKSVAGSAGARGLNGSGATLKALTNYGQNAASEEYGKVYGRESSRLTGLAGLGMNAMNGLQGAAQNYGNQMAGITTGLGNAQAAAQVANAQAGANRMTGLASLAGGVAGAAMAPPGMWAQGAQAGAGIGAAGGQFLFSDERVKKDLSKIGKADIEELQESLTPYTFKYKNEEHGEGEFPGVMAQDLEKSKLGRMVVEEKDGVKTVNLKKLASLSLAMMAKGEK
jgi:hypothetical protein